MAKKSKQTTLSSPSSSDKKKPFSSSTLRSPRFYYNQIKSFNDRLYTGMRIGTSHKWIYHDGKWYETKITPNLWKILYNANKSRIRSAPLGSGAEINSGFHWLIVADQKAIKIDSNAYTTHMKGLKFKVGYKRPHWHTWSYNYRGHDYVEEIIKVLEDLLLRLKTQRFVRELSIKSDKTLAFLADLWTSIES